MQGVILEAYQTAVTVWIVLIQFNELFNRLKLKMDYKELGHMLNEMEQIKIMLQSNHYNTNQQAFNWMMLRNRGIMLMS